MAIVQNLLIDQGTTFALDLTVSGVDGSAKNLSDYTAAAQMRKSYYSSTATDFTATITDAASGQLEITLTAAQTSALKAGRYVYDVEITSASETLRIIEGIITVTPEVTK